MAGHTKTEKSIIRSRSVREVKGFSLTEVLVVTGLLAIIAGIATVSYQFYIKTAEKQTLKKALMDLDSQFRSCLVFNKMDSKQCDTLEKISYKENPKMTVRIRKDNTHTNLCLMATYAIVSRDNREGRRACIQYKNGKMVRKCFETGKEYSRGMAICNPNTGVCCTICTDPVKRNCPVWKSP